MQGLHEPKVTTLILRGLPANPRLWQKSAEVIVDCQMCVAQWSIEGLNVGIRRMIYNEFIAQAMKAETRKRTPGLSWRPEAENHVGGAEPSDAISRSKPCMKVCR